MTTIVKLLNVRLAFPNLFTAKAGEQGGDPKFSASFIMPRDHAALPAIAEAMRAAAVTKWGAKAEDVLLALKAGGKLAVHDGDAKAKYEGYKGNLYLNANNKLRPLVIGGGPDGRSPLTEADGKLYAGCFVNAQVSFWAQDNKFGQRVNAELMGVQFLKDGPRLSAGGATASADDFEAIVPEKTAEAAKTGAASLF